MSFYRLSDGSTPEGSEKANMENFVLIPEGTIANAKILLAELADADPMNGSDDRYVVEYELLDGEFKGNKVRQNIKAFDKDPKKKDKAIDMLVRIMKLCRFSPPHADAPTSSDLLALKQMKIQIKIGQWDMNGNSGNFVRGVYYFNECEVQTGIFVEPKTKPPLPASQGHGAPLPGDTSGGFIDDNLPF
jgi:hypothetical protein